MATTTGFHSTPGARRLRRGSAAVLFAAVLLVGAACSSNADPPATSGTAVSTRSGEGGTSTTATVSGEPGNSTTSGSGPATTADPTDDVGTGEASPEVTAYCDDIDEVVQLMADMRANPSNDAVNEVNDRLAQLTETATQLMADHPDEVDRINDCAEALLDN